MSYECEYCDHCGSKINIDSVHPISELNQNINSANKGESAILCETCKKDYDDGITLVEE